MKRATPLTNACAVGLIVLGVSQPAQALLQSCTVSATSVPFMVYDPTDINGRSGTGVITVSCSVLLLGLFESWDIFLNGGLNSSFPRQMTPLVGSTKLKYNLYTTAGHGTVWGDGSAGTEKVSDMQTLVIGNNSYHYTVYGFIPAFQDLRPTSYSDTITVTLNYN